MSHQRNGLRRNSCGRRASRRLLCSDLVRVSWTDTAGRHSEVAVLESLSPAGIGLFTGVPVREKSPIEIVSKRGPLKGIVKRCDFRENGYVIGIELNLEYRRAQPLNIGLIRDQLSPEHLIDLSLLEFD